MRVSKRLFVIASAAAVLPLFTGATSAFAAKPAGSVKAVTHTSHHADTCACTTSELLAGRGYVWAYDNLSRQFVVTPNADGTYTVALTDNGSFTAFSEPNNADKNHNYPITATGSVKGTYTMTVEAAQAPDPSALPAQVDSDLSTSDTVRMLFGGTATIHGGAYNWTYRSGGETYVQDSDAGISGDITGH